MQNHLLHRYICMEGVTAPLLHHPNQSRCHANGHSWLQRQNWDCGTMIKEKIKENICPILHCNVPDFKYDSSLCLETTENTLKMRQTEEVWGTLVYNHSYCIVFAYLVGRRMAPTHIINTTLVRANLVMGTENCNASPLHRGHYRHRNPSHIVISMWMSRFMET